MRSSLAVHCPLTDQTRHLVAAPQLALMKPGAILVNASRGAIAAVRGEALPTPVSSG